jgi:two-component system KDP operon response regulator KdpE
LAEIRRFTILVVEDDATISEMLRILLEDEGCTIAAASSGKAAIGELERLRPDLVTLDLNLPDMDGLQLLNHLGDIPTIIVSARAYVPRGQGNVIAVLEKPFDVTRLSEAVETARRHLARPADAGRSSA